MINFLIFIYKKIIDEINFLRAVFYKIFFKKIGKKASFEKRCIITEPRGIEVGDNFKLSHDSYLGGGKLKIGNDCFFGHNCHVEGAGGVFIGDFFMAGPNVSILSATHEYKNSVPIVSQGLKLDEVRIGDDVWLGTNVVVLPGVTIHRGSIVGANAVVTKDIGEYQIVGGVPAKFIKNRFEK